MRDTRQRLAGVGNVPTPAIKRALCCLQAAVLLMGFAFLWTPKIPTQAAVRFTGFAFLWTQKIPTYAPRLQAACRQFLDIGVNLAF